MSPNLAPPRGARTFLSWITPRGSVGDAIIGDLQEEYVQHATNRGVAVARSWYVGQVIRSSFPLLGSRARRCTNSKALRAAVLGSLTVVLALIAAVPLAIMTLSALHVPTFVRPLIYLAVMCAAVGAGGYVAAAKAQIRSRGAVVLTTGFSCTLLIMIFLVSPEPEPLGVWLLWLPAVLSISVAGASLPRQQT